jgi:hypothetical protein
MKRVWLGLLLVSVPVGVLAQGSVLRENLPLSRPPVNVAPPDNAVTVTPPDDAVTIAPLPPPDQTDDQRGMVPNPLNDPGAGQPAGKQTQQQGQPRRADWVRMGTATLQTLDKVNARGDTMVLKVGDSGRFGSLVITVRGCYVRASDQPADATAFLVIRDERPDAPGFSGWMVRSAPYMSMLAHPIYDVRVAGCSP